MRRPRPSTITGTPQPIELVAGRRGHDLRLVRQPHRALPAQDRRRRWRRTSTSPPSGRPCASTRAWPAARRLEAAIEAAGYDVRPEPPRPPTPLGLRRGRTRTPRRVRASSASSAIKAAVSIARGARHHGPDALAGRRRACPWRRSTGCPARARHVRPVLGRRRLPARRRAGGAPPHRDHGHAGRHRHDRRLGLQRRGHAVAGARDGGRPRAGHLLRLRRPSSSASSSPAAGWRRAPGRRPAGAVRALVGLQARTRTPRATATTEIDVPDRAGPARRPGARPARREGAGRRRRHRGRLERRRVDAHRRVACRSTRARGDQVIGATLNSSGTLRHPRHARRPRHASWPRSCAWSRGAGLQGAHPAPGRPRQRRGSCRSSSCLAALTFAVWLAARAGARAHAARWSRPSPCSSSPAPAPWAWRRRPRSWSAPAGRPRRASSSAAARRSRRPGGSTPSSSTRPAR